MEKRQNKGRPPPTARGFSLSTIPVYLLSKCFAVVKPFAPQIIPLIVFAFLIPLVLFLSAGAGLAVWNNVAVGWEVPLYLQYGDGPSPYASVSLPALFSQQPYDISLRLTVPTTQSNVELGNFMASLRLASTSNNTIVTVRRPAIVIPPHASLFRPQPSMTTIDILLLPSYKPSTSYMDATIQLGRQDHWKSVGSGIGREIAVLDAKLHGVVVHNGIRGIVTRFPILSSLTASAIFVVVMLSIMGVCMLPTMIPSGSRESDYESLDEEEKPISVPKKRRSISSVKREEHTEDRRRSSRVSRSSSRRSQVKREEDQDEGVPIPGPSSATPLRRRRSRLSGSEPES